MSRSPSDREHTKKPQEDKRIDISTADDVNVDDDNDVDSPKKALTAEAPAEPKGDTPISTNPQKNPGDEVAPDTKQTGKLPCEQCGGTGRLNDRACPECGGTGEVVVNVGDA